MYCDALKVEGRVLEMEVPCSCWRRGAGATCIPGECRAHHPLTREGIILAVLHNHTSPFPSQGYATRQTKSAKTTKDWACWHSITSNHSVVEAKEYPLLSTSATSHCEAFHTMFGSNNRRNIEEA